MANGRDFYTTPSYLFYIPTYHDIQTNLELYIDYFPETVYHFSCGLVCYCIIRNKNGWFIKTRGLYNPKGTFKTIFKSKDFLETLARFQELINNYLTVILGNSDEEIPF